MLAELALRKAFAFAFAAVKPFKLLAIEPFALLDFASLPCEFEEGVLVAALLDLDPPLFEGAAFAA